MIVQRTLKMEWQIAMPRKEADSFRIKGLNIAEMIQNTVSQITVPITLNIR